MARESSSHKTEAGLTVMQIILAQPRGFCAGVDRAIEIVERALDMYGSPVYVRHEIVHNRYVVDDLRQKGAIFVKEIDEIPAGSITIFSAHGVSQEVEDSAKLRDLPLIDATCPLVTRVHNEARRGERDGNQVILIGHEGHPEVIGTSGRVEQGVLLITTPEDVEQLEVDDPEKLTYVTQTTLSVNDTRDVLKALSARFPSIKGPDLSDICYATQNRQDAIAQLAGMVDLLLVVGAQNSSNSSRLRDFGDKIGTVSYLIGSADAIEDEWLIGVEKVGITAGASAPEVLVEEVVEYLKDFDKTAVVEVMSGIEEKVKFKLPSEVLTKVL